MCLCVAAKLGIYVPSAPSGQQRLVWWVWASGPVDVGAFPVDVGAWDFCAVWWQGLDDASVIDGKTKC